MVCCADRALFLFLLLLLIKENRLYFLWGHFSSLWTTNNRWLSLMFLNNNTCICCTCCLSCWCCWLQRISFKCIVVVVIIILLICLTVVFDCRFQNFNHCHWLFHWSYHQIVVVIMFLIRCRNSLWLRKTVVSLMNFIGLLMFSYQSVKFASI